MQFLPHNKSLLQQQVKTMHLFKIAMNILLFLCCFLKEVPAKYSAKFLLRLVFIHFLQNSIIEDIKHRIPSLYAQNNTAVYQKNLLQLQIFYEDFNFEMIEEVESYKVIVIYFFKWISSYFTMGPSIKFNTNWPISKTLWKSHV